MRYLQSAAQCDQRMSETALPFWHISKPKLCGLPYARRLILGFHVVNFSLVCANGFRKAIEDQFLYQL